MKFIKLISGVPAIGAPFGDARLAAVEQRDGLVDGGLDPGPVGETLRPVVEGLFDNLFDVLHVVPVVQSAPLSIRSRSAWPSRSC